MPFSFSALASVLAEAGATVQKAIPTTVLFPLSAVTVAFAFIVGQVRGWQELGEFWDARTEIEKILLAAVATVAFILLGMLLDALQGTLSRWFLGDWPDGPLLAAMKVAMVRNHQARRDELVAAQRGLERTYHIVGRLRETLTMIGQGAEEPPRGLAARCALPAFRTLTKADVRETAKNLPSDPLPELPDDEVWITLRGFAAGEAIARADVLRVSDVALLDGRLIVPLELGREAAPAHLTRGDRVRLFCAGPGCPAVLGERAWLALAVEPFQRRHKDGATEEIVRVTLALTPEAAAAATESADRLRFVAALEPPPIVPCPDDPALPQPSPLPCRTLRKSSSHPEVMILEERVGNEYKEIGRLLVDQELANGIPPNNCSSAYVVDQAKITKPRFRKLLKRIDKELREVDRRLRDATSADWRARPEERLDLIVEAGNTLAEIWRQSALLDASTDGRAEEFDRTMRDFLDAIEELYKILQYRWDQIQKAYSFQYPRNEGAVVATRIGNAIMTVDTYCHETFGLDLARTLPRLRAVLDVSKLAGLTRADQRLAMLEWSLVGSLLVALAGTVIAAWDGRLGLALLVLTTSGALTWAATQSAVNAAMGYADELRLLFDHERGRVPAAAGFEVPDKMEQASERDMWERLTYWWDQGDAPGQYTMPGAPAESTTEAT